MTAQELVCERHGTPTLLACAGCGAGICPQCMSRTQVGFKCPSCVGQRERPHRRPPAGAVWVASAVAVLAVAAVLLRPSHRDSSDPVAPGAAASAGPTAEPMLGEDAADGQITFVVTDFSCPAGPLQTEGGARTPEGRFCQLRISAHNASAGPAAVLTRFQYLLDAQSKTYGPDIALSQAMADNRGRNLAELNVNPDITVAFVLVYDVPAALDPVEAQLRGTGRSRFGIRVRLQPRV